MSHMSAANTPATGPVLNRRPPALDIGQSLAEGRTEPPIHELEPENGQGQHNKYPLNDHAGDGSVNSSELGDFGPNHPLYQDLAPDDSYKNGIYWVSLIFRRSGFLSHTVADFVSSARPISLWVNESAGSTHNPTERHSENSDISVKWSKTTHFLLLPPTFEDMSLVVSVSSQRVTREWER